MIHIAWLVQRFTEADAGNHEKVAFLKARRDEALNVFETFTVRSNNSASEAVRRQVRNSAAATLIPSLC